jgi:hypothetical protein
MDGLGDALGEVTVKAVFEVVMDVIASGVVPLLAKVSVPDSL